MNIEWRAQDPPLNPSAVVARGELGRWLAARAADNGEFILSRMGDWSVLEGRPLPAQDGLIKLGVLDGAEKVLVPVDLVPDMDAAEVLRAIRARLGDDPPGRIALVPSGDKAVLLPLDGKG